MCIFGISENKLENTDLIVTALINNKLHVNISLDDVDQRNDTHTDSKMHPIIVKFPSYRNRQEVFSNKRNLKGSKISIKEGLTKMRLMVYLKAVEKFDTKNAGRENFL